MNSIALSSSAFNQEEFDYTSRQPDTVHQKETLLKKLIRKGHNSCELFLQELAKKADISKYAGPSELTGKNHAGPTMFSAYRSESPVKICSLLWSANNFLFVSPSNSVFKSRSFLQ